MTAREIRRPRTEAHNDNVPAWPWSAWHPFKRLPPARNVPASGGKPAGKSWTGNEPKDPKRLSRRWALHFTPRRLVHVSGWQMPLVGVSSFEMFTLHAEARLPAGDVAELKRLLATLEVSNASETGTRRDHRGGSEEARPDVGAGDQSDDAYPDAEGDWGAWADGEAANG